MTTIDRQTIIEYVPWLNMCRTFASHGKLSSRFGKSLASSLSDHFPALHTQLPYQGYQNHIRAFDHSLIPTNPIQTKNDIKMVDDDDSSTTTSTHHLPNDSTLISNLLQHEPLCRSLHSTVYTTDGNRIDTPPRSLVAGRWFYLEEIAILMQKAQISVIYVDISHINLQYYQSVCEIYHRPDLLLALNDGLLQHNANMEQLQEYYEGLSPSTSTVISITATPPTFDPILLPFPIPFIYLLMHKNNLFIVDSHDLVSNTLNHTFENNQGTIWSRYILEHSHIFPSSFLSPHFYNDLQLKSNNFTAPINTHQLQSQPGYQAITSTVVPFDTIGVKYLYSPLTTTTIIADYLNTGHFTVRLDAADLTFIPFLHPAISSFTWYKAKQLKGLRTRLDRQAKQANKNTNTQSQNVHNVISSPHANTNPTISSQSSSQPTPKQQLDQLEAELNEKEAKLLSKHHNCGDFLCTLFTPMRMFDNDPKPLIQFQSEEQFKMIQYHNNNNDGTVVTSPHPQPPTNPNHLEMITEHSKDYIIQQTSSFERSSMRNVKESIKFIKTKMGDNYQFEILHLGALTSNLPTTTSNLSIATQTTLSTENHSNTIGANSNNNMTTSQPPAPQDDKQEPNQSKQQPTTKKSKAPFTTTIESDVYVVHTKRVITNVVTTTNENNNQLKIDPTATPLPITNHSSSPPTATSTMTDVESINPSSSQSLSKHSTFRRYNFYPFIDQSLCLATSCSKLCSCSLKKPQSLDHSTNTINNHHVFYQECTRSSAAILLVALYCAFFQIPLIQYNSDSTNTLHIDITSLQYHLQANYSSIHSDLNSSLLNNDANNESHQLSKESTKVFLNIHQAALILDDLSHLLIETPLYRTELLSIDALSEYTSVSPHYIASSNNDHLNNNNNNNIKSDDSQQPKKVSQQLPIAGCTCIFRLSVVCISALLMADLVMVNQPILSTATIGNSKEQARHRGGGGKNNNNKNNNNNDPSVVRKQYDVNPVAKFHPGDGPTSTYMHILCVFSQQISYQQALLINTVCDALVRLDQKSPPSSSPRYDYLEHAANKVNISLLFQIITMITTYPIVFNTTIATGANIGTLIPHNQLLTFNAPNITSDHLSSDF